MKRLFLIAVLASIFAGCDKQRDLYVKTDTVLHIEGSWSTSLDKSEMLDATVLLYKDGAMNKEFLSRPNGITTKVSRGNYDMLIFNGLMESEEATNLNHVYFRGTDRLETFEAVAVEGIPNQRLSRAEGEYIASNEMELFTFAHSSVFVEGTNGYYIKYKDGKNGYPVVENNVEGQMDMVTRAVSYRFQIRLTNVVNASSARLAAGAVKGFAGSVFLTSPHGKPQAGFSATHHLKLSQPTGGNRTRPGLNGEELGTIQSSVFVTFGPPLPESLAELKSSGQYTFEPCFVLSDNSEFTLEPIDITAQVNEIIERIDAHHGGEGDITHDDNYFVIEISDRMELPVIAPENVVEVAEWEDTEEVMVWIRH